MDGLEVKVQLGSVWKQSLTELSGGQRSVLYFWSGAERIVDVYKSVQIPYCPLPHHGPPTVQAGTHVHPRRN